VDTELTFSVLSDDTFNRQITKDLILEDALNFLLLPLTHLSSDTQVSPSHFKGSIHHNEKKKLIVTLLNNLDKWINKHSKRDKSVRI